MNGISQLKEEIEVLKAKLDRQRADLAATNLALCAVFASIPDPFRSRVFDYLARESAKKAAYVEQLPTSAAGQAQAVRTLQEAEERIHAMLQGTHRQLKTQEEAGER